MNKPEYTKDLEWYDDGYTMEEQAKFKREYEASKKVLHLTPAYQNAAADALISKLKQQLAASEAYVEELEESKVLKELNDLKQQHEKLTLNYTKLNNKYSCLINEGKFVDEVYIQQKETIHLLQDEIDSLKKEIELLKLDKNHLIYELNKYR